MLSLSESSQFAQRIVALAELIRHVKTPEGAKFFGLPIGTLITSDMAHPSFKSIQQLKDLPPGTRIRYQSEVNAKVKTFFVKQSDGTWKNEITSKYGTVGTLPGIGTSRLTLTSIPGEAKADPFPAGHGPLPPEPVKPPEPVQALPPGTFATVASVAEAQASPEGTKVTNTLGTAVYVHVGDKWISAKTGKAVNLDVPISHGNMHYVEKLVAVEAPVIPEPPLVVEIVPNPVPEPVETPNALVPQKVVSVIQLISLPTGSVILNTDSSGAKYQYIKEGSGLWKTHGTWDDQDGTWSSSDFDNFIANEQLTIWSTPASEFKGLSIAEFDQLPVGATIKAKVGDYVYTKTKPHWWSDPNGTLIEDWKMLPHNLALISAEPVEVPKKDYAVGDPILKSAFDELPTGSLIGINGLNSKYQKLENGHWAYVKQSGELTGNYSPKDFSSDDSYMVAQVGPSLKSTKTLKIAGVTLTEQQAQEALAGLKGEPKTFFAALPKDSPLKSDDLSLESFGIQATNAQVVNAHVTALLESFLNLGIQVGDKISGPEMDKLPIGSKITFHVGDTVKNFELHSHGVWKHVGFFGEFQSSEFSKDKIYTVASIGSAVLPVEINVKGKTFIIPGDAKTYHSSNIKNADEAQVKYVRTVDGAWYSYGAVMGSKTLKLNEYEIYNSAVASGDLVSDDTVIETPTVEPIVPVAPAIIPHPSGLAPGKYSTGPNAKVFLVILDNGKAFYVDKKGESKALGPKAVTSLHEAAMDFYGGPWTGAPLEPAQAGPVTFVAQGGQQSYEAPAGSKVFHVAVKTWADADSKYVLKSNGVWAITANGVLHDQPADIGANLTLKVEQGKLVADEMAKTATVIAPIVNVSYPFSGPPDISSGKSNELKKEIVKLVDESGYKNIAGLNRLGMTNVQKADWLKYWYAGDWNKAFEVERLAGAFGDTEAIPKSAEELDAAPIGAKLWMVDETKKVTQLATKLEGGNWGFNQWNSGFDSAYFLQLYGPKLRWPDKVVHPKADKHPGSPTFPGNINGFKKIEFGSAVPGEIPAGSPVSVSFDVELNLAKPSYYWSQEYVDAYLLAANMVNSQGLDHYSKKAWVEKHRGGDKIGTDKLSLQAQHNVELGKFYSSEIFPPKPVAIAEHSVMPYMTETFPDLKAFNTGSSHAVNLTETQTNAYIGQLFSGKTKAVVVQQPLDLKRAIVQLHWLSAMPTTKGAYKTQEQATTEYDTMWQSITAQVANKPTDSYGNITDPGLSLPPINKVTAWMKAPASQQQNFKGTHTKFIVLDDTGKPYFFKTFQDGQWRAQIADSANRAGRLFGVDTVWSDLATIDGSYGQLQGLVVNKEDLKGVAPSDSTLTETEFLDLMKYQVFDWVLGQDDSHWEQFVKQPNGHLQHLDLDRAWIFAANPDAPGQQKLTLESLSYGQAQPSVYYKNVFNAVIDGKFNEKTVQKGYRQAILRAKYIKSVSDERYLELLKSGPLQNPNLSEAQKKAFVTEALSRKNRVVEDLESFWEEIFTKSGLAKPDPPSLSDHPGLHTGFTPELLADVKASRNWGHATFFAGRDLEDGHVIVWEEHADPQENVPDNINGQMQLLSSGDAKMVAWLAANYAGPGKTQNDSVSLDGQEKYEAAISHFYETVKFNIDHNYFGYDEAASANAEQVVAGIQSALDNNASAKIYPEDPEKAAAHREMLEHYLKAYNDVVAARESRVSPAEFKLYVYTPAAGVKLKPDYKVRKEGAILHVAKLDSKTNILTATEDMSSDGQSGSEYVINVDGIEIVYRPHDSANLSQQGLLRFRKSDYQDNIDYGSRIMEFLRSEVGIEADEATDQDLELQYWRTAYGILQDRFDSAKTFPDGSSTLRVTNAVNTNDPRNMTDKNDELLRWREVWSELNGPELVDKWVETQGYLPQFSRTLPQDHENVHGRPYWMRFDVDVNKLRLEKQFLVRSMYGLGGGETPEADGPTLVALKSGGVIPGEERARIIGRWIGKSVGGSAEADQVKGSSMFTMNRQNIEKESYHIYFDPALLARLNTYTFITDHYGEIKKRKHESYWNIKDATKHARSSNEVAVKYGDTILDDAALVVFYSESKRKEALDYYASLGVTRIGGLPIEKAFVSVANRAQGLHDAHEAMTARVMAGQAYVPPASSYVAAPPAFVAGQKVTDVAELDAMPTEATVAYSKDFKNYYTKQADGTWLSHLVQDLKTTADISVSGFVKADDFSGMIASGELVSINKPKTKPVVGGTVESVDQLEAAMIGTQISVDWSDGPHPEDPKQETYTKTSAGNWASSYLSGTYEASEFSDVVPEGEGKATWSYLPATEKPTKAIDPALLVLPQPNVALYAAVGSMMEPNSGPDIGDVFTKNDSGTWHSTLSGVYSDSAMQHEIDAGHMFWVLKGKVGNRDSLDVAPEDSQFITDLGYHYVKVGSGLGKWKSLETGKVFDGKNFYKSKFHDQSGMPVEDDASAEFNNAAGITGTWAVPGKDSVPSLKYLDGLPVGTKISLTVGLGGDEYVKTDKGWLGESGHSLPTTSFHPLETKLVSLPPTAEELLASLNDLPVAKTEIPKIKNAIYSQQELDDAPAGSKVSVQDPLMVSPSIFTKQDHGAWIEGSNEDVTYTSQPGDFYGFNQMDKGQVQWVLQYLTAKDLTDALVGAKVQVGLVILTKKADGYWLSDTGSTWSAEQILGIPLGDGKLIWA